MFVGFAEFASKIPMSTISSTCGAKMPRLSSFWKTLEVLGGQNRVPGRPHHKAFRAGRTSGCAWDRDPRADIGKW